MKTLIRIMIIMSFLFIQCFASITFSAQENKSPSKFEIALAKAKEDPKKADFKELRMQWTKDFSYAPHYNVDVNYENLYYDLNKALQKQKYNKVIKRCEKILDICYLDILAHIFCKKAYQKLELQEKADFHNAFAQGLLQSILSSGDGESAQTAYKVVTHIEEYTLMLLQNYKVEMQSLEMSDRGNFDVFSVKHKKTGEKTDIYFDTGSIHDFLYRLFDFDDETFSDEPEEAESEKKK